MHFVVSLDVLTFTTTVAFVAHANFGVWTHFGKRNDINRILYLLLLVATRRLQQTFTLFSLSLYEFFYVVLSQMRKSSFGRTVGDILFNENHYSTWFGLSNLNNVQHSSHKT